MFFSQTERTILTSRLIALIALVKRGSITTHPKFDMESENVTLEFWRWDPGIKPSFYRIL